jgi:hypothetical protein
MKPLENDNAEIQRAVFTGFAIKKFREAHRWVITKKDEKQQQQKA